MTGCTLIFIQIQNEVGHNEWAGAGSKGSPAQAERVTISYSPVKSGSSQKRSLEDAILRLDALKLEFCQLVNQQVSRRCDVEQMLARLPNDRDRIMFRMRYVGRMSWPQVGEALGLIPNRVCKLHGKLLALLDDLDHQSSTDSSQ